MNKTKRGLKTLIGNWEVKKQIDFFIKRPFKLAHDLKEKLYSDDSFYRQTSHAFVGPEDAKKLFFYGVCIEIGKACIQMMHISELFDGIPSETESGPSDEWRIVHNSILDSQYRLIRKLTELLAVVINFSTSYSDLDYRIYHSAINLHRLLNRKKSFSGLFGVTNNNNQSMIDSFKERLDQDITSNGNAVPWFLHKTRYSELKLSWFFLSWFDTYSQALNIGNNEERLALGLSYQKYSNLSNNVHSFITSIDYEENEDWDMVISNIKQIGLIGMHILDRSYEILDLPDTNWLKKIMWEKFEKSVAPEVMKGFARSFDVGDIVLQQGTYLWEIIDSIDGKFWYKIYQIKYLGKSPLSTYSEDWVPSDQLIRIFETKNVRIFFNDLLWSSAKAQDSVEQVFKTMSEESDEVLLKSMKSVLTDLHQKGLLIPMLSSKNKTKSVDPDGG